VSDGVVVTEKTVVILLPEFTEPGIGVNGPDIVVFKDLRKEVWDFESVRVAPINEPPYDLKDAIELTTLDILDAVGTYTLMSKTEIYKAFSDM
jgi:hypothetical protein